MLSFMSCGPSKTELAMEHLRDSVRISDSLSVYIFADEARRDSLRRLDSLNQARLERQRRDSAYRAQVVAAAAADSANATAETETPQAQ